MLVLNKWHVFSICIWLVPLVFTSKKKKKEIKKENVFRSEIYWQQTAQITKWVQAIVNFAQPMGFSVLAIEKNCKKCIKQNNTYEQQQIGWTFFMY